MLLASQKKRKQDDIDTNYLTVTWSTQVVRFSEEKQLIDILDCLGLLYGSTSSAQNTQSKWFGTTTTSETEDALDIERGTLLWKTKWKDTGRGKLSMKIQDMQKFLDVKLPHLARGRDLSAILNTPHLTVMGACGLPLNSGAAPCSETEQSGCTAQPIDNAQLVHSGSGLSVITKADVFKFASSRAMETTCNLWLFATDKESEKRAVLAHNEKEKAWLERSVVADRTAKEFEVNTAVAEARKRNEIEALEARKKNEVEALEARKKNEVEAAEARNKNEVESDLLKSTTNTLMFKLKTAEGCGMHEDVVNLKRKLRVLLE